MKNILIDNSTEALSMKEQIKKLMGLPHIKEIEIATGYWDLPGTAMLVSELSTFLAKEGTILKLMIGRDPYIYSGCLVRDGEAYSLANEIRHKLDELHIKENYSTYQQTVELLRRYVAKDGKIQVKKCTEDQDGNPCFFHSKCYIFVADDKKECRAILGSSNFTRDGITEQGNTELNIMETDGEVVMKEPSNQDASFGHHYWYNQFWDKAQDWSEEFIEIINDAAPEPLPETPVEEVKPLTPYETYIKYLQMHYGDLVDPSTTEKLKSYLPDGFNALNYQLDAVKQCFQILKNYGGFFLADVVGLGKTIVGLLIIKKFIEEAQTLHGRQPNVLIVVPPAIRKGWEETIKKFDENKPYAITDYITFITTDSIGGLLQDEELELSSREDDGDEFEDEVHYNDYGLILVDESHNFRNSETQKYRSLKNLIESIAMRGKAPYVGLLSATPQNNSPKDLKNQIYLFQLDPNNSDFEIDAKYGNKLDSYFVAQQDIFEGCRNNNTPESKQALKEMSEDIRKKILEHIVVRRTRRDIKEIYANDAESLKFPTVMPPHKLHYTMDDELIELFADTITKILPPLDGEAPGTEHIEYVRYSAIMFFKDPQNTKLYEKRNLTVEKISARIAKIMRILLVKRIESSFAAFTQSLENLCRYTKNMIDMIDHDCVFICPDIDVNAEFKNNNFDWTSTQAAIREKIQRKKGNNREFKASDFKPEYRRKLKEDYSLLCRMKDAWKSNDFDPKKDAFHEAIKEQLFAKDINNPHQYDTQRLVIFTEAKDTQEEIARYLKHQGYDVLKINADNRKELQDTISENFDANAETQKDDYNVIVTTEVLAEGVNLHRSNVILNYDTPWNATRLMQRIGRVNRIGSKEDKVHVFNFFPTSQSNAQIKLLQKTYAKLQTFHTMFGEDNQIMLEEEELSDANFTQIVEGELSLDAPFVTDLKQYEQDNPERYQELAAMQARELGGQREGLQEACVLMNSERRNQACYIVDSENAVQHVMPLSFMEHLRCEKEAAFAENPDKDKLQNLTDLVEREYNRMLSRTKTAKDARRRATNALQKIRAIRDLVTTQEAKDAIAGAERAIRDLNSIAIKLIEKFSAGELLFGPDEDINMQITAMFNKFADKVNQQYGESYVALYTI